MSYQHFAYYYDELMEDAPYSKWAEFFVEAAKKYKADVHSILDVACGTGSLSLKLAQKGFNVTGIDLSEDMLAIAHEKTRNQEFSIPFYHQDMRELSGLGEYDAAAIFCDSLNYLVEESDVLSAFQSIYSHLKKDGLFLFDVHSPYKMQEKFIGQTFGSHEEHLSYIWHCYEGEKPLSVEHDLSFFLKTGNVYERFDEVHIQRTWPHEVYEDLLLKAGFKVQSITGDFSLSTLSNKAERIFFIAQKS